MKMNKKNELKKVYEEEGILGLILGIGGMILFFDFASIDSQIFGVSAPWWIERISQFFDISPMFIDVLMTISIIALFLTFRLNKESGRLEGSMGKKRGRK